MRYKVAFIVIAGLMHITFSLGCTVNAEDTNKMSNSESVDAKKSIGSSMAKAIQAASEGQSIEESTETIIDSSMTWDQAIQGTKAPESILKDLTMISLTYWGFDNAVHQGQMVIHQSLVKDITSIFKELFQLRFPIQKMIPISYYQWMDEVSMQDNNTSAFNYRSMPNTQSKLSQHAYGKAIDINPRLNPYIHKNKTLPDGAVYDPHKPGTFVNNSPAVKAFTKRGWRWGGTFKSLKDYQHFEK